MKLIPLFALLTTLSLSACDKADQERKEAIKDKAEAIDKKADAVKAEAKSEAHTTQAAGEERAKDLKKEADAVRDQKPN